MKKVDTGTIIFNRELSPAYYLMGLDVPAYFQDALPGQFVMLRIPGQDFPFLGRPFSIYSLSRQTDNSVIEILYRVAGKGTDLFSRMKHGERLNILGPLGNAFDIAAERKHITLVAGGVGVAPLSFLAESYRRRFSDTTLHISCYLGAKSEQLLIGRDRLQKTCSSVKVSTDDGSAGYHGSVTDLLRDDFLSRSTEESFIYACGPHPMLKNLAGVLERHSYPCQVSVEERMACGIGTCLGCTVVIKPETTGKRFVRACTEGPVFDITAIEWN